MRKVVWSIVVTLALLTMGLVFEPAVAVEQCTPNPNGAGTGPSAQQTCSGGGGGGGSSCVGGPPCDCDQGSPFPEDGQFCLYANVLYGRLIFGPSNSPPGSDGISVPRDDAESGANFTANNWCGVDEHHFPEPDRTVWAWAPEDRAPTLGTANNVIDHLYVRVLSRPCDAAH